MTSNTDILSGKKILAIDDDANYLVGLTHVFTKLSCTIYTATDGQAGLRQFFNCDFDLVIVDLRMPGLNGWEVCQRIRQMSSVPLLMLTACCEDDDIVQGLERGADEYLFKPVAISVLLARIRALLRRVTLSVSECPTTQYDDGYLTLDLIQRRVLVQGQSIRLTEREYELLGYLFRHANQVRPHRQILTDIWGEAQPQSADLVHKNIRRLRQKLETDPKRPRYLLTEHGVGYRFHKDS
jgi:two-component system KDP operon response regulator KdpE